MAQGISDIFEEVRNDPNKKDLAPNTSITELTRDITMDKSKYFLDEAKKNAEEVQKRIELVRKLNELKREINAAKKDGAFDAKDNEQLQQLLNEVRELDLDINHTGDGADKKQTIPGIKTDKTKYSKEDTENLMSSLNTGIEDLNTQNQMQSQKVNRNYQFFTEVYSMAKEIQKILNDAIRKPLQGIR